MMSMSFSRISTLLLTCLLALLVSAPVRAQEARLSNLAIRTQGGGGETLITGFTVGAGSSKRVLIRAVGPTLGVFGVPGTMPNPKLELYSGSNKIAENDDWRPSDAAAFATVGAFALGEGARDAALVAELAPGSYTAQVTGDVAGVTLVEVYELAGSTTRLVNLSTRAQVGTGDNILIPGLTIAPGSGTRRLLIRAVGPTLGGFGVPGVLSDPKLELYSGATKAAENDNWGTPLGTGAATSTQIAEVSATAGAFPLTVGSRDAAILTALSPGSYTLQISGVGATTGAALVEVYDVSPSAPVQPAGVAPSITTQPVAATVSRGQAAVFTAAATGTPAPTYQWRRNGTALNGATGPILRLASAEAADAGNYDVVVTNSVGSITSRAVALTVMGGINATVALLPSATALAAGQSVTLRATVTGATATTYRWLRDGADIRTAPSTATYTLTNVSPEDVGVFTVEATTSLGVLRSAPVTLALDPGAGEIVLNGTQFFRTTAEGTAIGTFHSVASDGSRNLTYALVAGAGSEDNASFSIAGDKLRTAATFLGQARAVWSIRVRVSDAAGRTVEKSFALRLVDASGVAGIFRTLSDPVVGGLPFPVVESRVSLDFDLECPVVSWHGEKDAHYAIEYSADGNSAWRLVINAKDIVPYATDIQQFTDYSADFDTRSRYYRVRRIDPPESQFIPIQPPASTTGVAGLALSTGRELVIAPSFNDLIVDGNEQQADYYEIHVPTSIGLQHRQTGKTIDLKISRNFEQGATFTVNIYGYTWSGQLISALVNRRHQVHFNEADFPSVPNHHPTGRTALAGVVNIYGSAAQNSLRTAYDRTDRASGSRILDLIFDREDGSARNYGAFRLLLPRGVAAGNQAWTSLDAYNRSVTGACKIEAPFSDNITLFTGGSWSHIGDFRWSSLGPNLIDGRSYGSFNIKLLNSDTLYNVWQILLVTSETSEASPFARIHIVLRR